MTNPLVTWLPAAAATALLVTAGFVMQSDAGGSPSRGRDDSDQDQDQVEDTLDADARTAVKDDDGSEMLAAMERQLVQARRILATARDTTPTKEGFKQLKSLNWQAGQELNDLRRMKNNVSEEVFSRGNAITKEIADTLRQVSSLYDAYRRQRDTARASAPNKPQQPAPEQSPQQLPPQQPPQLPPAQQPFAAAPAGVPQHDYGQQHDGPEGHDGHDGHDEYGEDEHDEELEELR